MGSQLHTVRWGSRRGGGQFYDMRVKAIVQPYSILGSAHGVKKYDFFIKEDEQMNILTKVNYINRCTLLINLELEK